MPYLQLLPSCPSLVVDAIFLLAVIVLYAVTQWLLAAVARLRGGE